MVNQVVGPDPNGQRRRTGSASLFKKGVMSSENNPYQAPSTGPTYDGSLATPPVLRPGRAFRYSYFTSLAVALAIVPVWLVMLSRAAPPGQTRTRPPDVLETLFVFVTTLPSVLTCLCFSIAYCAIAKKYEIRRMWMWPAVLFGVVSGLMFNGMTAITVIEHLFDW